MSPQHQPASDEMVKGRQKDSARRRSRVETALSDAVAAGAEITVTSIAASAGVDRTFLYRHRDLLARLQAAQTQPAPEGAAAAVTKASLQADLLAAQQRTTRLGAHIRQLEKRLSELLGEQTWQDSGLGAPTDIEQLQQQIAHAEQQTIDLRLQLESRDDELAAARATNRELMTQLNASHDTK